MNIIFLPIVEDALASTVPTTKTHEMPLPKRHGLLPRATDARRTYD